MAMAKKILWSKGERFTPAWPFPKAARVPLKTCRDQRHDPNTGEVEKCGREHGHRDRMHASFLEDGRTPYMVWERPADVTVCANCGAQIRYHGQYAEWQVTVGSDMHHSYVNVCPAQIGGHRPVFD